MKSEREQAKQTCGGNNGICFQFFNELDMLKIRLNVLNDVVDRFVISEATETFSGIKKPLYYEENEEMFAEFEEWAHKTHENDGTLSKDKLCEKYFELNKDYFGKKVKLLDETKYEWARIPHFFTPFYVYKYATGLICAINFASKIASGDKKATKDYINRFLCAGQSKPPVQILADAGCDLNKEQTYAYVFDELKNILKEWKNL